MRLTPLAYSLLVASGSLLSAANLYAEEKPLELPTMVVSATGYKQQALMAPASITVIDSEQIVRVPSADIAEVFRDIPGVDVVDSGFPGMKRLSLRGESARRVLIKINGQPILDHSNYGTPLMIDPAMIERIELVRGSASVVHGSNAIGGVINIITHRPEQGEQILMASAGYYSATHGFKMSAGVLGAKDNVDYRFQASRVDHGERRIPHGKLENTESYTQSFSGEVGANFGDARISWQGDYFNQEVHAWADGSNGVDALALPERSTMRNALRYENDLQGDTLKKVTAQVYYQEGKRILENEVTARVPVLPPSFPPAFNINNIKNTSDDVLTTAGAQLYFESNVFGENTTLFGVEYLLDKLVTDKVAQTKTTPESGGATTYVEKFSSQSAEQQTWSAFVQQQIKMTQSVEANLGIRYYDIQSDLNRSSERNTTDEHDGQLVGSASLAWQATTNSSLRLNIAQGYTYPSLTQQFAVTAGGRDMHFGNPELKAEKSTTYELGWRIDGQRLTLDAVVYQSKAKDFIDRKAITAADVTALGYNAAGTNNWLWVNASEADSYGAELAVAYQIAAWRPYVNASMQERELTFANGYKTKDSGLPSYMSRAGVQWDVLSNLNIDAYARSQGNALRREDTGDVAKLGESHRFVTWNLAALYQPTQTVTVSAALLNLTNRTYQNNPDELIAAERALDVEVNWRF